MPYFIVITSEHTIDHKRLQCERQAKEQGSGVLHDIVCRVDPYIHKDIIYSDTLNLISL